MAGCAQDHPDDGLAHQRCLYEATQEELAEDDGSLPSEVRSRPGAQPERERDDDQRSGEHPGRLPAPQPCRRARLTYVG